MGIAYLRCPLVKPQGNPGPGGGGSPTGSGGGGSRVARGDSGDSNGNDGSNTLTGWSVILGWAKQ